MPKGKRELVPRNQVLPLIVVNYLFNTSDKKQVVSHQFYT